jgi:hypothetical protein
MYVKIYINQLYMHLRFDNDVYVIKKIVIIRRVL